MLTFPEIARARCQIDRDNGLQSGSFHYQTIYVLLLEIHPPPGLKYSRGVLFAFL